MALASLLTLCPWTSADAHLIQFTFRGQVDTVQGDVPDPWGDTAVGSIFSVVYVFDSETPDLWPDIPDEGLYAVESLSVGIDDVYLSAQSAEIIVADLLVEDQYFVYFNDVLDDAGGNLFLAGEHAFDSDALPLDLDLDDFNLNTAFEFLGAEYRIDGTVDSFSRKVVPSPSTFVLLGLGMTSLGRRRSHA